MACANADSVWYLTSLETITDFANKHPTSLTVMENGEHLFHTDEQILFLDKWIKEKSYSHLTLRDKPELKDEAAEWFMDVTIEIHVP